jgi:ABC-type cobalamin transport system ATPase subunit
VGQASQAVEKFGVVPRADARGWSNVSQIRGAKISRARRGTGECPFFRSLFSLSSKLSRCCKNRLSGTLTRYPVDIGAWMARILNSSANLLLLDEPTNHLEIEAQEALEEALEMYPGTVIAVSHDRAFLTALGDQKQNLYLPSFQ